MVTRYDLIQALDILRLTDMPIQHLMALLFIADKEEMEEPVEVNKLCEWLGCTLASASRITDYLSTKGWGKKKGMGYILKTTSTNDKRYRVLKMTPKGKHFIKSIMNLINNNERNE